MPIVVVPRHTPVRVGGGGHGVRRRANMRPPQKGATSLTTLSRPWQESLHPVHWWPV
ncbi:MAG: hypothetical protein ACK4SY_06495 [Pyrobaculum sp.]